LHNFHQRIVVRFFFRRERDYRKRLNSHNLINLYFFFEGKSIFE
jgi:hypothetical protein